MLTSSKIRLSILCSILLPTIMHAELTVDANHKAVVDTSDLQLPAPRAITTVGIPLVVCALVGAACSEGNGTATTVGAVVGALIGVREHMAYSSAHQAADGLNLMGTAAMHNLDGAKKLLEYSQGWYLFKQQDGCTYLKQPIGSPLEVDATGKTALHYAGAANEVPIAKEILKVAPKKITEFETTGRSKTTQDATHTMRVGQTTTGGVWGAVAGLAVGSVSKDATTTVGGNKEKTDERAIHQTYVDLKDDAGRSAGNWAARAQAAEILLLLEERGADSDIPDKFDKQSVRTIIAGDPVLQKALDQAKGK